MAPAAWPLMADKDQTLASAAAGSRVAAVLALVGAQVGNIAHIAPVAMAAEEVLRFLVVVVSGAQVQSIALGQQAPQRMDIVQVEEAEQAVDITSTRPAVLIVVMCMQMAVGVVMAQAARSLPPSMRQVILDKNILIN